MSDVHFKNDSKFRFCYRSKISSVLFMFAIIFATTLKTHQALAARGGELVIKVIDRDTSKPIACRIHLTRLNPRNRRPTIIKAPKAPSWSDHFVIDGEIKLKLKLGNYRFVMERGPEYLIRTGHFTIKDFANDEKVVDMKRFVNMAEKGWYAGDLHVVRSIRDIEPLMRAEDLYVAPVTTWTNKKNQFKGKTFPKELLIKFDQNRYYSKMAGYDSRLGNMVQYFHLQKSIQLPTYKKSLPSVLSVISKAQEADLVHVNVARAFSWDLPIWVAHQKVDSISLANSHLQRTKMLTNEAGGYKRDMLRYPNPNGNGRWSQDIYYHLLNCGLTIPPAAGSGSGEVSNPVGYNRVYVHVDGEFSYKKWWEALRAGRSVITNGPLLQPKANGKLPGHTFRSSDGEPLELQITLTLSTRDKIDYLEVIKNGETAHEVRLSDWQKARGKLPPIKFDHSGWFLVRAVTNVGTTYRFASSAPYYVSIHNKPAISKTSSKFFLDWTKKRSDKIVKDKLQQSNESKAQLQKALDYWQKMVKNANVD